MNRISGIIPPFIKQSSTIQSVKHVYSCLDEIFAFSQENFDPEVRNLKNGKIILPFLHRQVTDLSDQNYSTLCVFLASKARKLYLDHPPAFSNAFDYQIQLDSKKMKDVETHQEDPHLPLPLLNMTNGLMVLLGASARTSLRWWAGSSQHLADTIEANILLFGKNLSDELDNIFPGTTLTTTEKVFTRLVFMLNHVINRFKQLENASEQDKAVMPRIIFEDIVEDLADLLLPKGPKSLHVLHPLLPADVVREKGWKALKGALTTFLLKQGPDLLRPFVDKEANETKLRTNPNGELYIQTCQAIAHELVQKVPTWIKENDFTKLFLKDMKPLWPLLQEYLECVLLKIAADIASRDKDILRKIEELIEKSKTIPSLNADDAITFLNQIVDQVFDLAGFRSTNDLYGIPLAYQSKLFALAKKALFDRLFLAYKIYTGLKARAMPVNKIEEQIPNTKLAKACSASIRYVLDLGLDKIDQKKEAGIDQLYSSVKPLLSKFESNGNKVAQVAKLVMERQVANPWVELVFGLTDQIQKDQRDHIAELVSPLIMEYALKALTPILEAEKRDQKAFDHKVLNVFLPLLTEHLKVLQGKQNPVALSAADKQEFYTAQSEILLKLLFPNGEQDLLQAIPELTPEMSAVVWNLIQSNLQKALPDIIPKLFTRPAMKKMVVKVLRRVHRVLSKPAASTKKKNHEKDPDMDLLVGNFALESLRLFNVPVDKLSSLPGWKSITDKSSEALGASIRGKMDGSFFLNTIRDTVLPLMEKRTYKRTNKAVDVQITDFEKVIAHQVLEKVAHSLVDKIADRLKFLDVPVIKQVKDLVVEIYAFVILKILTPLARQMGVEKFIEKKIDKMTNAALNLLEKPELHENFIFQLIEAFEKKLMAESHPPVIE